MTQLTWESATDWDNAQAEESVAHDAYGDLQDDRVQLGYHPFDEGGTELSAFHSLDNADGTDETGNGYTATVNGATEGPGTVGTTGLSFDGTDDYMTFPTDIGTSIGDNTHSWYVCFWLKTTTTDYPHFFHDFDGNTYGMDFMVNDAAGGLEAQIRQFDGSDSTNVEISGVTPRDGNWHFWGGGYDLENDLLVLTYDDQHAGEGPPSGDASNSKDPEIMRDGVRGGGPYYIEGQLDAIRWYDRMPSQAERENLYEVGVQGSLTTAKKTS